MLLISDSGGIQKEASILGVPLIVLRRSTERPEALTSRCVLTIDLTQLASLTTALITDTSLGATSPFGDGRAFARIANLVELTARKWKALLETVCMTR